MLDALLDALIDSLKLLPFLFITYLLMELLESKAGEKSLKIIKRSGKFGPILGGLLGIVPQCGFSAAAANLYAGRIITIGSLIAIFLSTSDEMLPILISEAAPINLIIEILLIKLLIGILSGICVDFILRKRKKTEYEENHIHDICQDEHCHCEEEGILKSSIKHTLHIFTYILIITIIINIFIYFIGEENIAHIATNIPVLGNLIASIMGLIPNCASSVILTQLYLQNILTFGCLISGLLVNSGIGMLVLFKVNKNKKENMAILGILFVIGLISGIIIDFI